MSERDDHYSFAEPPSEYATAMLPLLAVLREQLLLGARVVVPGETAASGGCRHYLKAAALPPLHLCAAHVLPCVPMLLTIRPSHLVHDGPAVPAPQEDPTTELLKLSRMKGVP